MFNTQKVTAFCRFERIIKDEHGNDTGERELLFSDENIEDSPIIIKKIKDFCTGMTTDPNFLKNKLGD